MENSLRRLLTWRFTHLLFNQKSFEREKFNIILLNPLFYPTCHNIPYFHFQILCIKCQLNPSHVSGNLHLKLEFQMNDNMVRFDGVQPFTPPPWISLLPIPFYILFSPPGFHFILLISINSFLIQIDRFNFLS